MSQSTDAKAAYGVDLGDDFPEWMKTLTGADDWYDAREALEGTDLELVTHCSDSCTMYVLAVAGTVQTAWRGQPRKLEAPEPTAEQSAAWDKVRMHPECADPRWLLFSWWC